MRLKFLKRLAIGSLVMVLAGSGVSVFAEQDNPVAPSPKFKPTGTYVVKKGNAFTEELTSTERGSKIYYTMDDKKAPLVDGKVYTKPIPVSVNTVAIKAVNTKEGFSNSSEAARYYSFSSANAPKPYKGIKIKKLQKGKKKVKGTLKFKSEITLYVNVKVKNSKGKTKKYSTKVKKGKWCLKLNKKLKKGDKVTISAYTKDYLVTLTKDKKESNRMNVIQEFVPSSTWIPVKRKI